MNDEPMNPVLRIAALGLLILYFILLFGFPVLSYFIKK